MTDHEPTLGEVARRIDAYDQARSHSERQLRESIGELRSDMRADREHTANTYVRKDVNDAAMREVRDDITELKGNWSNQQDRNRQIVIGVVVGFALIVAGIIANALGFTTGGGA